MVARGAASVTSSTFDTRGEDDDGCPEDDEEPFDLATLRFGRGADCLIVSGGSGTLSVRRNGVEHDGPAATAWLVMDRSAGTGRTEASARATGAGASRGRSAGRSTEGAAGWARRSTSGSGASAFLGTTAVEAGTVVGGKAGFGFVFADVCCPIRDAAFPTTGLAFAATVGGGAGTTAADFCAGPNDRVGLSSSSDFLPEATSEDVGRDLSDWLLPSRLKLSSGLTLGRRVRVLPEAATGGAGSGRGLVAGGGCGFVEAEAWGAAVTMGSFASDAMDWVESDVLTEVERASRAASGRERSAATTGRSSGGEDEDWLDRSMPTFLRASRCRRSKRSSLPPPVVEVTEAERRSGAGATRVSVGRGLGGTASRGIVAAAELELEAVRGWTTAAIMSLMA